ncbi:MAG: T9SS type A sorting domain-containing protein [Bacteroidetes bacterium]|nr:T9SS type A sorting domain-containing protein [Bacteroidota bacterium]
MKLNLPLMGAALSLAVGLNAQTGRHAAITKNSPAVTVNSQAGRNCGTAAPSEEWNNWFNQKVNEFQANLATGKTQMVNYTIPVVVHIIHTGQTAGTGANISAAQVQDQINILNADFAGTGFNVSQLASTTFSSVGASNTGISFCLAKKDPAGVTLTEFGIDRLNATTKGWTAGPYTQAYMDGTIKPNSIWDPTRYLNIWVANLGGGLLGYATFPAGTGLIGLGGFGTATTDGVVILNTAFGSIGSATAPPYNKGRSATHEIGHWVGLRHIWGDGTCLTDYVNDTPPAQQSNFGCPAYPHNVGVCAGNTTGEMTMNFMDYTDDPCMYMFTPNQNTRMQTAMQSGTYRSQLSASASTLCTIAAAAPVASMSIPSSGCTNSSVATNNLSNGNPTPTYAWSSNPSAGVTFNPNSTATNPTVIFATPGSYTLTVVATNSLGSNSNSKSITITTCTAAAVSCNDTLTNANNTDTLFTDAYSGGYIGGNNGYGDKEKAEYFSSAGLVGNANIIGGIVVFYKHATANIGTKGTSNLVFKIYAGNNTSGPTGLPLKTFTASITSILASATATNGVSYCGNPNLTYNSNVMRPYSFNFPTPTAITGDFFLSVQLPSTTGDTAAIFVTGENGRTASTGWELQTPSTWVPFNDGTTTSWQLNASLAILPKISCATAINKNSVLDNNVVLYPNPSNGMVNIITTLPGTQNLDITVYNALGQLVSSIKHNAISNDVFELDMKNQSSGVYFISINNGQEKIVKRLIINK